jgi:hypothetical protein
MRTLETWRDRFHRIEADLPIFRAETMQFTVGDEEAVEQR